MLTLGIFGIFGTCLLVWLFKIFLRHRRYSHIPGPPRSSFIGGNAAYILREGKRLGNAGKVLLNLALEYGNTLVFWVGPQPRLVMSEPLDIKECFTNCSLYVKPDFEERFFDISKIGSTSYLGRHTLLTVCGGPVWEHKKRIMDPGFKLTKLQDFIHKLYRIGEQVLEDMVEAQQDRGYIHFREIIAPYTIHAISSAGFSVTDETLLNELSQGNQALSNYVVDQMPRFNTLLYKHLRIGGSPLTTTAESQLNRIRTIAKTLILGRIESGQLGRVGDSLDMIIRANEAGGSLELEGCVDEFLTMYEAGNLTTSTTMGYFVAEMVRNPEIQSRLIEEVKAEFGDISSGSSNEEIAAAINQMKYLDCCVKETLRKHPPVVIGVKENTRRVVLCGGYAIPSNTKIMVSQEVLHHHPAHWDAPQLFNPDRFMDEKRTVKPYTYFPFILGPRRCLGKNFALLEIKVFLALWLRCLRFEKHPETPQEITTEQSLVTRIIDSRVIVKQL